MLNGEMDDSSAKNHGVVAFCDTKADREECGILTFSANNRLINEPFDRIWDFAYNATGKHLFEDGGLYVYVDFDRDEVATLSNDERPKFHKMNDADYYTRSKSTFYDINRGDKYYKNGRLKKSADYEDKFAPMDMKGRFDYGDDGMEEVKKVLSRHGYKVINEDYEMTDDEKDFSTTFKMDFNIADRFGVKAVKDTFRRAFAEWKNDYRYLTDLVLVLNHKIWQHYETNEELARVYNSLWEKARDYAESHLKGHEMDYYFKLTD